MKKGCKVGYCVFKWSLNYTPLRADPNTAGSLFHALTASCVKNVNLILFKFIGLFQFI